MPVWPPEGCACAIELDISAVAAVTAVNASMTAAFVAADDVPSTSARESSPQAMATIIAAEAASIANRARIFFIYLTSVSGVPVSQRDGNS